MSYFLAEFIGTFLLIFLGNGVNANLFLQNTKAVKENHWFFICTGWALAVFVAVGVSAPYSGAHINPAVTLGLAAAGKFDCSLVPTYILAQFLGAMSGALFVYFFYYPHYKQTESDSAIRATFCTEPATRHFASNFFSEFMGTFILVFVLLFFTNPELSIDGQVPEFFGLGSIGALPVAILVWVIGMALGGTTGYAINPARDLGPRFIHQLLPFKGASDWAYAWVPVLGPTFGGLVAGLLYIGFFN